MKKVSSEKEYVKEEIRQDFRLERMILSSDGLLSKGAQLSLQPYILM